MSLASLALFLAAYGLAVASPGPAVAALVARVLARGTGGVAAFIGGCVLGDLIWFGVAAFGLAAAARAFEGVFTLVRYAGAAYLLVIAWKLWTAPAAAVTAPPAAARVLGWREFLAGLALTLGNPKVIVFFLALLPAVVDLAHLTPLGMAELAALIPLTLGTTLAAYALAAGRARRLLATPSRVRALNRATGAVMAGAALAVATR